MKTTIIALLFVSTLSVGCAHKHVVEGHQPADQIPEGVRVKIGSPEVKEGDTVNVFRQICKEKRPAGRGGEETQSCANEKIGEASVLKVLDQDSAVILPSAGLTIEKNMLVEKQ